MKLSIKNLKGEVFQVQVEPTDSIEILKTKIQEAKGLAADSLKIVFKGKTAANEDTIEKLAIKETDFIVVMTQVQKPQPKPKEEVKPEPVKVEAEKKEVPKPEEKREAPKPTQPQQPAANHEAEIQELMSMGFPRDQCETALRAAFYNMQRAVEYIFNGIPSNLGQGRVQQEAEEGGPAPGPQQLRAIFNHPQLANIRNLIRQNPAALQPLLAQLAQSAPPLYNLIAQYPQQFEQIILQGEAQGSESQPAAQNQPQNPPPGTILISHADEQAINRLRQLGFSKLQSAQAYFACDKNQELAANLLFDRLANGDIEMEPQVPGGQGHGGPGGQGGNANNEDDDDNLFN